MPTTPTRVPLADAIRRAIRESGLSFNELGRLAGIDPGQLSRFASGSRDLTTAVASRVCMALGYELAHTGEVVSEPLPEPPPSTRNRPKGSPPPASAFSRGQGRRVDLEKGQGELEEVDVPKAAVAPRNPSSRLGRGTPKNAENKAVEKTRQRRKKPTKR